MTLLLPALIVTLLASQPTVPTAVQPGLTLNSPPVLVAFDGFDDDGGGSDEAASDDDSGDAGETMDGADHSVPSGDSASGDAGDAEVPDSGFHTGFNQDTE